MDTHNETIFGMGVLLMAVRLGFSKSFFSHKLQRFILSYVVIWMSTFVTFD